MNLGIYETKTDFCIISRIDFFLLDMFVGMCKNRVSLYATTKNLTTVYATNGAICVCCNLLILTRVECPTFPKMAPETCPQPEAAKLPYKKLGDSDLLISEITLGTVCAELNHHVSVVVVGPVFLHLSLMFTSLR